MQRMTKLPGQVLRLIVAGFFFVMFSAGSIRAQTGVESNMTSVTNDCAVLTCPNDRTFFVCAETFTIPAGLVTANNICTGGKLEVVCDPPVSTPLKAGTHKIACGALVNGKVVVRCSFTVTVVQDLKPPTLDCPPDIFVDNCGDLCVVVKYPAPVATDDSGAVSVKCDPPSGFCFPVGVTVVKCVAVDRCQNRAECSFKVVVRPARAVPGIQCLTNLTVFTCGDCEKVFYPAPIVVGGNLVGCSPPPGTCFPLGITTVSCVATNECGVKSECQFTVTVRPKASDLAIRCPQPITVTVPCGKECAVVNYPPPVVANGVLVGCTPPSGSCFPLGLTTVICVAKDECGHEVKCEFPIRVVPDGDALPKIACPADIVVESCGRCEKVVYAAPGVGGGTLAYCNPPSGSCFPPGITVVSCVATNACGQKSECRFTVTVMPKASGLAIRCPEPITVVAGCNISCAVVNYPAPAVANGVLVGCTPPSGSCFPVGVNEVICVAKDECGRETKCRFLIRVVQETVNPPVIRCPKDFVVLAPCGKDCAVVNYPAPLVGNGILSGCTPPSGKCFPIGDTIVTCLATNACGQRAECKFTVTVRPNPGEVAIRCPENLTFTVPCEKECVVVNYPRPGVSGGVLVSCTPPPGSCLPVGIHSVICVAKDECGHETKCEFSIRVIRGQGTPPLIRCPQNLSVVAECGKDCTPVFYPAPVVVNGTLVGCQPPPGFCFPVGQTVVQCLATNSCGGKAECRFVVTVRPARAVAIQCPIEPMVVGLPCDQNCAVVNYPPPVVVNGTLVSCTPAPGSCFAVGIHTITCVAKDDCGGQVNCEFRIRVVPTAEQPIGIRCPEDVVVKTCDTCVEVGYPAPEVVNGTLLECDPPPGTCFPVGTNRVVCRVSNECGQTKTCSFNVIVLPGPSCIRPPQNMVLWLGFDEAIGPVAHNLVAGTPHGIHVNGPVPFLGQIVDNSLCFDGVDDRVQVPNYGAIQFGKRNFSIDTWLLRRDGGGRRTIVSKVVSGVAGRAGYEYYLENGIMMLALHAPAGGSLVFNSAVVAPADNRWHLVAATVQREGGAEPRVRFYLDGNVVSVVNGGIPGSVNNNADLSVGSGSVGSQGSYFRGYLDELEMFNRVLAPGEVRALWLAGSSGKCKVKCSIPWDITIAPGQECATVLARLGNCTAEPLTIVWSAVGPMPIPTANGVVTVPPFSSTNVPVILCRQPNQPPGTLLRWVLRASPGNRCPVECVGSLINPSRQLTVNLPELPVLVPGNTVPKPIRIGLDGLPPGARLRLVAIGPDMEPDMDTLSLNGLPPGTPWVIGGPVGAARAGLLASTTLQEFDVPVQFAGEDPSGTYTVLISADLDGNGTEEVVGSFDVESPAVQPPLLSVAGDDLGLSIGWEDGGNGLGTLQGAIGPDGPWVGIPEATPGYRPDSDSPLRFFRVRIGTIEE